GKAHLYGTFKLIDMTGDIYADNLRLKIGFTNTAYTVSDSVHIRPGEIRFNDVVLHDVKGHTALLSGRLTHKFFKEPRFRFDITDTRDFLCYDVKKNDLNPWYGTIYGNNGIASITGAPGRVNISVTMDTAPHSAFTFIISDTQSAAEYDFITFRDRDRQKKDSIASLDTTPVLVKQFRNKAKNNDTGEPTLYSMDFNIGVDPGATMTIIMDPIAGDSIRATGSGKMNMKYSNDGDLDIRGTYTINKGSYNFTLQDIFLKNFTLKEGSSITFKGDPYSAELDITAINSVKANLSDLDESFLQDKELNTTSVTVDALLYARGDMRHPDISYDIIIPSSPEVNRKVHS
ncbi:MAG: translocation/assembly module TamB, partial [Duncaniella sp.]|nr:translocation/assembly module TamB [Duncaniella sp.]